jgi:hypothetical protein
MPGTKGRWSRLWVDEWDMSTKTASAEVSLAVGTEEVTTFQATGKEYITTDPEGSIKVNGYVTALAAGTGGLEEEFQERFAAANTAMVGLMLADSASGDAGMPVYVLPATSLDSLKITAPATGVLGIDGSFMAGDYGLRRGVCLWRGAVTVTGNKTSYDLGAAGSAGGDVYVWVQSITGTATNASIKVQSATTSGGTYSDEATVTFSAVGDFTAAMTGAVSQWVRVNVAAMGGATSITLAVVAAVDGVTQPA